MTNFDWLSDLQPIFAAQESWLDGSYNQPVTAHLVCQTKVSFAISCGGGLLAEHIRQFRVAAAIVQRLGQVTDTHGRMVFQESFLNHLQRLRLRAQVNAAPEGTLLLPGEPVLSIHASELELRLLGSALRMLVWESTYWATKSAWEQWQEGVFSEEETPPAPVFPFNKTGWKMRARYIGGGDSGSSSDDFESSDEWGGLIKIEHSPDQTLAQIRRLFKAGQPLGDVWLTAAQDANASVSQTHIKFMDGKTDKAVEVQMSRFQNLLLPVLVKGHPALNSPSLDYLRQRTWKQLAAFHAVGLKGYRQGWHAGNSIWASD